MSAAPAPVCGARRPDSQPVPRQRRWAGFRLYRLRRVRSGDSAVVDQHCRVHGVENLRVVDTSIMPTVVRRCPAATAVMIGERAAAFFA